MLNASKISICRYERILERLKRETNFDRSEPLRQHCSELFTWLVFAKRPLKWREIQAAKSIDVDRQTVDFSERQLMDTAKEICGAFVEEHPDGTVDFIHLTAK